MIPCVSSEFLTLSSTRGVLKAQARWQSRSSLQIPFKSNFNKFLLFSLFYIVRLELCLVVKWIASKLLPNQKCLDARIKPSLRLNLSISLLCTIKSCSIVIHRAVSFPKCSVPPLH